MIYITTDIIFNLLSIVIIIFWLIKRESERLPICFLPFIELLGICSRDWELSAWCFLIDCWARARGCWEKWEGGEVRWAMKSCEATKSGKTLSCICIFGSSDRFVILLNSLRKRFYQKRGINVIVIVSHDIDISHRNFFRVKATDEKKKKEKKIKKKRSRSWNDSLLLLVVIIVNFRALGKKGKGCECAKATHTRACVCAREWVIK